MNMRWRGAAIVAALLLGAPAYGQGSGSQMGTGGQRSPGDDSARSTTSNQGTGSSANEQGSSRSTGSASSAQGTGSAGATAQGGHQLSKDLAKAVQEMHAGNQFEVELGKIAAQTAQSPEVKQFAELMQKDHQKNDDQLQELARTMGANLTGEEFQEKQKEGQEKIGDLQKKQGAEFDKAYMSAMVKDHKKDVKDVEKAAKEARKEKHTQLASFFETTHTALQGHLQHAERIEKQLKQGAGQARTKSSSEMGTGSGGATSPGGGTGGSGKTGGGTGGGGTH